MDDFDQISLDGEPVGADDGQGDGLNDEDEFGMNEMGDEGGGGGERAALDHDSEGESEMVVLDPNHPLMAR